VVFLFITCDIK